MCVCVLLYLSTWWEEKGGEEGRGRREEKKGGEDRREGVLRQMSGREHGTESGVSDREQFR